MNRREPFHLEKRESIYGFILKYPGVHLRKILRELKMSTGDVRYHVDYLLKKGLIEKKYDGKYVRYYVKDEIGTDEKEILNFLRKETTRNIILCLLIHPCGSQTSISKMIEKDPTTTSFHLKKLLEKNVIELSDYSNGFASLNYKKMKFIKVRSKKPREIIYRLKDPYLVYHVLSKYRKKFFDKDTTISILRLFEWCTEFDPPEKTGGIEDGEDNIIDFFYDIFPHPYR